ALHAVLDILYSDLSIMDLLLVVRSYPQCQQINDVSIIIRMGSLKGLGNGNADFRKLKIRDLAVPFYYLIHETALLSFVFMCPDPGRSRSPDVSERSLLYLPYRLLSSIKPQYIVSFIILLTKYR